MRMTKAFLLTLVLSCVCNSAFAGSGFDDRFRVHSGDLNGDGRTDLFLKWTPKVTMITVDDISFPVPLTKRDVSDFVLQQTTTGAFTLLGNLTSTQRNAVADWPEANSAVQLAQDDFNFDGRLDLVIRNLKALIAGADVQIIFASKTAGAAPAALSAINTPMKNLYREVGNWFKAPVVTDIYSWVDWYYVGSSWNYEPWFFCAGFYDCRVIYDDPWDPAGNPGDDPYEQNMYHYYGGILQSVAVTYHNYKLPDPKAYNYANVLWSTQPMGELKIPSSEGGILQQIMDEVFGLPTHVVIGEEFPQDVDPDLRASWNWGQVMYHMGKIWVEVCMPVTGDDAKVCWRNMLAPSFPGLSFCQTHGPFDGNGPVLDYSITAQQRAMNASNQRRPFWISRYEGCDPFAPAALGVVDNEGLGMVTMKWLRAVAKEKGLTINETQLGYDIMHAHVGKTDSDTFNILGLLSKKQISDYHQQVFASYGLPDYTFGGSPLGGGWGGDLMRDFLGKATWCPDCDKLP